MSVDTRRDSKAREQRIYLCPGHRYLTTTSCHPSHHACIKKYFSLTTSRCIELHNILKYLHDNLPVSNRRSCSKIPRWRQVTQTGQLWPLPYLWSNYIQTITSQIHKFTKPHFTDETNYQTNSTNTYIHSSLPVSRTQKSPNLDINQTNTIINQNTNGAHCGVTDKICNAQTFYYWTGHRKWTYCNQ